MKTYTEQLAEVQTAITDVLTRGQEYEISTPNGTRRVRRANLTDLREREQALIPLAASEAAGRSGGRRTRQIAPG